MITPSRRKSGSNPIEDYLNSNYTFRINLVKNRTEYQKVGSSDFQLIDNRALNSIYRELGNADLQCTMQDLKNLLYSDYVPMVDVFEEYFKALPVWDKKTDYIKELADTISVDNSAFWEDWLKKWLVALVACSLGKKANHQVLVLHGKQGSGKTTWLNKLVPNSLKEYIYQGVIHPENKDTLCFISECMFINMDELETLNKTELGTIKSLITQENIKVRRPYEVFADSFIRRASFMGSVNDTDFLTDSTGNRRYLCFTCNSIDYKHQLDIDKVYSQAYSLFISGYKYWFDGKEIEEINLQNEIFKKVDVSEDLLLQYFEPSKNRFECEFMTATEILIYIQKESGVDLVRESVRMGKVLTKYFEKSKVTGKSGYYVKKIPLEIVHTKNKGNEGVIDIENSLINRIDEIDDNSEVKFDTKEMQDYLNYIDGVDLEEFLPPSYHLKGNTNEEKAKNALFFIEDTLKEKPELLQNVLNGLNIQGAGAIFEYYDKLHIVASI